MNRKILVISIGATVAVGALLFGLHNASPKTVAAHHAANPVAGTVLKQPATPEPTPAPEMHRVDVYFPDLLTETQEDIFRRAHNAHVRGRIGTALREYMALQAELDQPSALVENRLGVVYHALGNHSFAAHQFTAAIAAGDNHISRWNRAKANLDNRRCENAIEDAEWLLENEEQKIHQAATTWLDMGPQATTHMAAHYVMAECHAPDRTAEWWSEGEPATEEQDDEGGKSTRVSPCHSAFHNWVRNKSAMRVNPSGRLQISPRQPCTNQWSSEERKATFVEHAQKGLSMVHAARMRECPYYGRSRLPVDACPFLRRYFQDAQAAGMGIHETLAVTPDTPCKLEKPALDEDLKDDIYNDLLGERPLGKVNKEEMATALTEYYECLTKSRQKNQNK